MGIRLYPTINVKQQFSSPNRLVDDISLDDRSVRELICRLGIAVIVLSLFLVVRPIGVILLSGKFAVFVGVDPFEEASAKSVRKFRLRNKAVAIFVPLLKRRLWLRRFSVVCLLGSAYGRRSQKRNQGSHEDDSLTNLASVPQ